VKALDRALTAVIPTAWGLLGVEVGPRGVRQLRLPQSTERRAWDALGSPPLGSRVKPEALGDLVGRLRAYLRGEPTAFADAVDLDGVTAFQRAVYTAARDIPCGQVITYGDLAARAGHPGAARAVGQALARNPVCLIIPCHRVVGAGGALVGFGGGLALKERLLRLEATPSQAVAGEPATPRYG